MVESIALRLIDEFSVRQKTRTCLINNSFEMYISDKQDISIMGIWGNA